MKITRNIKEKPKLSLILALLAIGMLLPWHSTLFSGNNPSNKQLEEHEISEGKLSAHSGISAPQLKEEINFSPEISQGNSLISLSQPPKEISETETIRAIITAYSSTRDQTNASPRITAAGTEVRKGIVANNSLPFGTKIRIPELYGDREFVIKDRMHWQKTDNHFDIWFPSRQQALNFGAQKTYIEIVERPNQ